MEIVFNFNSITDTEEFYFNSFSAPANNKINYYVSTMTNDISKNATPCPFISVLIVCTK